MIIDVANLWSDDQAVTVTANSTNVIDLGADHARIQDLNEKGEIEVYAQVTTAFAGGTSIVVGVYEADVAAMTSETLVFETGVIATAALVAGYKFLLGKLPPITDRFLRLTFTVVGTHTAGNITSGLILDKQTNG